MCPFGFLGRIYAEHDGAALGLLTGLAEWSDANALRTLIAHGDDVVGNLLVRDFNESPHLQPRRRDRLPPSRAVDVNGYPES